jgi:hypothetical protein
LVRGYLERHEVDETVLKGVLHLNVRNPLLRRVRDLGPEHPDFAPLLSILVTNARMFAGQGLSAQDTIVCFEQINRSLALLAGLSEPELGLDAPLILATLTELGLHPDAAGRLCALCETVRALFDADIQALSERAHVSPLMLATVREELKAKLGQVQPRAADAGNGERPAKRGVLVSLRDLQASRDGEKGAE